MLVKCIQCKKEMQERKGTRKCHDCTKINSYQSVRNYQRDNGLQSLFRSRLHYQNPIMQYKELGLDYA